MLSGSSPRAAAVLRAATLLMAVACSPADDSPAAEAAWIGSIQTEGGVTTVITESGSVWGGTAALVEEASIGVEVGADEYMLGDVDGVAAAGDRIYVADVQTRTVRSYDGSGAYLADFGGVGEGPGEFQYPTGLGVDGTGRVWVHDLPGGRVLAYAASGELEATITIPGRRVSGGLSMVVAPGGEAYVLSVVPIPDAPADAPFSERILVGMMPYRIDGTSGQPLEIPRFEQEQVFLTVETEQIIRSIAAPFQPTGQYAFAPSGAVISGIPDAYRFEIAHADGARMIVDRYWEPVPVAADEASAYRDGAMAFMRQIDPGWVWSAPDTPATKPAFERFIPSRSGEVWVVRPGPGVPVAGCNPEADPDGNDLSPCWEQARIFDVFGADGRYLGTVDVPDELRLDPLPWIDGDTVVAVVEDEAGTIRVKRYRLVTRPE